MTNNDKTSNGVKKIYLLSIILMLGLVVVACTPKEQKQVTDTLTEEAMADEDKTMDDDAMGHDGDGVMEDDKMMDDEAMMEEDKMMDDGDAMEKDDEAMMEEDKMMDDEMMMINYSTDLEDISGGTASGTASASFKDGTYTLTASLSGLPEPSGTDFYEGWVVKKSPLDAISTGIINKVGGIYVNNFSDTRDLTDHDFYVVTIEPDDGDPAPAAHILEGTLTKN